MERIEADATPAEEWVQSLNATCNRLLTQYLNLLRSAASIVSLEEEQGIPGSTGTSASGNNNTTTGTNTNTTSGSKQHDPRGGGGHMVSIQDPPPPPLAADVAMSTLQCQLASENICVAVSNILTLIRTLKLSLLLMDDETIAAEEYIQVQRMHQLTQQAIQDTVLLEQQYMELRNS